MSRYNSGMCQRGGGAHWCDSLIIGENLEILYTDCASFPGFVCCVFCNKKLAEIHAMTISRKNSSKECIKVSSKMFFKGFQGICFLDNNKQFPITVCCITTELGICRELSKHCTVQWATEMANWLLSAEFSVSCLVSH